MTTSPPPKTWPLKSGVQAVYDMNRPGTGLRMDIDSTQTLGAAWTTWWLQANVQGGSVRDFGIGHVLGASLVQRAQEAGKHGALQLWTSAHL